MDMHIEEVLAFSSIVFTIKIGFGDE